MSLFTKAQIASLSGYIGKIDGTHLLDRKTYTFVDTTNITIHMHALLREFDQCLKQHGINSASDSDFPIATTDLGSVFSSNSVPIQYIDSYVLCILHDLGADQQVVETADLVKRVNTLAATNPIVQKLLALVKAQDNTHAIIESVNKLAGLHVLELTGTVIRINDNVRLDSISMI